MYNIIIYFPFPMKPTSGGVERVSKVLGDWFERQGHSVTYVSDYFLDNTSILPNDKVGLYDEENLRAFERYIQEKEIDYIINQAGILPQSYPLMKMNRGSTKIISVFHNSLYGMYSHPNIGINHRMLLKFAELSSVKWLFRKLFYHKYNSFLKGIVLNSDAVVLLSESYKSELKHFAGVDGELVVSIGNPLTLPIMSAEFNKKKEIIYLGRLSWQKRPDILLDIWRIVYKRHSDWTLRFIGDGEMKEYLAREIKKKNIRNVYLEGTRNPESYLKDASILGMTSSYEGFPLVLYEAMNYGVVPIALNTFAGLKDIVSNGYDGIVVSSGGYATFIKEMERLMEDTSELQRMSRNCLNTVKDKTIDNIGEKWIELFERI